MVYPVAYRAAAQAFKGATRYFPFFEIPPLPPAPLPLMAFAAAFMAMWKALDYFDPQGAEQIYSGLPYGPFSEAWDVLHAETAPVEPVEVQELLPIPSWAGWNANVVCGSCSGQAAWTDDAYCTGGPIGTCCSGVGAKATIDAHPFNPAGPDAEVYKCNPTRPLAASYASFRGSYTKKAATVPRAEPWKQTYAFEALAQMFDDARDDMDRPYFPTAWSLPIRNTGQVLNPAYPIPGTLTPARPLPRVEPLIDTPVVVRPARKTWPLVREVTEVTTAPGPRTNELKIRTLRSLMVFKSAYGAVTEIKDAACAMRKALPKRMQNKRKKQTWWSCAQDVIAAWPQLNSDIIRQMIVELIMNEIQDWTYGQFGKFNKVVSEKFFSKLDAPFGFQTFLGTSQGKGGGQFKMSPNLQPIEDTLRPFVQKMVEEAWGQGFEGMPWRSLQELTKYNQSVHKVRKGDLFK